MLEKSRLLKILLSVLVLLIVLTSVVLFKKGTEPRVVHVQPGPEYDPEILMMGVRISKFGGMSIYRDSPGVLLSRSEKLALTEDQQLRLEAIVHQARQQAVSVLTEPQRARISPAPEVPFVVAKLDPTFLTCETCSEGACSSSEHGHVHE